MHQEIQPLADHPTCRQDAPDFLHVGGKPSQLFVHIDFLCKQRELLTHALVVGRLQHLTHFGRQFLLIGLQQHRQQGTHFGDLLLHQCHALQDQPLEFVAFAPTCLRQILQAPIQQCKHICTQGVARDRLRR